MYSIREYFEMVPVSIEDGYSLAFTKLEELRESESSSPKYYSSSALLTMVNFGYDLTPTHHQHINSIIRYFLNN